MQDWVVIGNSNLKWTIFLHPLTVLPSQVGIPIMFIGKGHSLTSWMIMFFAINIFMSGAKLLV